MLNNAIKKIINRENLTLEEAEASMNEIMSGRCSQAQIAAFLIGLRMKNESIDEITGCAKMMKQHAISFDIEDTYAIDTCGTGGDGGKTFNISTAVSIIAAASGLGVTKHGNRAVSSKSGSADVLTELGFDIDMDFEKAKECFLETGMTFLFAQKYHTAMKNVALVRKDLATRTIFNILGPLTNPADIKGQVLGVFDGELTHPLAEVLMRLGRERAMVVHGNDGLDEITVTAKTKVSEVKDGVITDYIINPEDYGIEIASPEAIAGGDAIENAQIIIDVFKGKKGPERDIVVLNSAAALYVGKKADSFKEGIKLAKELIDSGKAYAKLEQLVSFSKRS